MEFEPVIGLEVHVQLSTASKMFCGSSAAFGGEPNEHIDPVTLGLPGALPVVNAKAVEFAIMLGRAMGCSIRANNRFARKHYFYPDLPKGYQISQFEEPICEHGKLEIRLDDGSKRVIGIRRIHMEEDAGKNIHDARTQTSLIDLNRAGVPLLEIVSEPDLRSAEEASAYLRTVRQLVRYLGVSDGNMEEGSLRCDANVSLRPSGSLKFGTRTETKNLNSFKFVERAIEYEMARQAGILRSNGTVQQETRLFDSADGTTRAMRSKEESSDYRYFPDPDLPPLHIAESRVREIESTMPKLPSQWEKELVSVYGLTEYDALVLTAERQSVEFFEKVFAISNNAKLACSWLTSELFGVLHKAGLTLAQSPISAQQLGELIKLIDTEVVSGKMAKSIFEEMFSSGKSPSEIVEAKGLKQITDDTQILAFVRAAFEKNASQLAGYIGGNDRLHAHFVGQVMALSKGAANPRKVNELIKSEVLRLRSEKA